MGGALCLAYFVLCVCASFVFIERAYGAVPLCWFVCRIASLARLFGLCVCWLILVRLVLHTERRQRANGEEGKGI